MKRRSFLKTVASACTAASLPILSCDSSNVKSPNIVLIYADDLGYGDLSCYGAHRVNTPNIDRIANEGVKFTNAYATAATCTPSRYSLLTGEYAWRRKGTGIAKGDASMIIPVGKTTIPSVLKKAGYTSAVVGKWHLGLGSQTPDWNKEIVPGPREIGFDYSFLIPATGDRVPCVFVENQRVVGLDTNDPISVSFGQKVGNDPVGREHPELLKVQADDQHSDTIVNGISRIGYMRGGNSARWVDEDFADILSKKAVSFIDKNQNNPFFLFFSLHDIHVPRVPHPRFVGKTDMGPRGDAIIQADWCVGQILEKLDELNLTENTIVIFSSDNGPVLNDGYMDNSVEKISDHKQSGQLRGGKYSSFEAGTRVPFVLRWPAKVSAKTSKAIISQVDLLASFARMVNQPLNDDEAIDSQNYLATFLGKINRGKDVVVQEPMGGYLAIRKNNWKYIEPTAGEAFMENKGIETGRDASPQLYDLSKDVNEQKNVAADNSDVVKDMQHVLAEIRQHGQKFTRTN